ncbi:MAG: hypothetical protein JNK77_04360 [Saprospiraceae bacterium]|nr:hypothetical protein [Saprospiraceae bacterium]
MCNLIFRIKLYTLLPALLSALALSSCQSPDAPQESPLKTMEWLVGSWKFNSKEGVIFENWRLAADTLLSGESGYLSEQDTVVSEHISLVKRGEDIFYIPIVYGQNEDKPTLFKLTSNKNNILVFENPQHDFPTKITYSMVTPDSMVAEISGLMEGHPERMLYLFARGK